ncbi:MAG: cadmium-translocating P-type ATPase [Oscillospiraceae bacterium]|nr:cadmium-translocating P-type ATPase [Oscillospiraceae bacterium]
MTKKQKTMLYRIIVSFTLFLVLFILEKTGTLNGLPVWSKAIMFAVPYVIIGYDIIYKAFRNISHGQVFDENFLMMVATFAAFGIGEYSEACAVMLFYQVGELFQNYAVGKSRQSIADMMSIAPEYANLEVDGDVEEVDPDDVEIGSIIVVRPGEKVPLDGIVIEGSSFLNTAALTGESVPRRVSEGDAIISGCVNGDSMLRVRVTKAYEDSTVAKILELVETASEKKAKLENFITRFARYYTPCVTIGAALLAFIPPLVLHQPISGWVHRACIFLIVSCPCALVISVPLGFFGGIGAASRIGVLVKGSNYLEAAAEMSTIVFDKTGTLTKGEFKVARIFPASGVDLDAEGLLAIAAHGESFSTHPIAQSVIEAYGKELSRHRVTDEQEISGQGVSSKLDGKTLLLGNAKLMQANGIEYEQNTMPGTVIYVAYDSEFIGSILISDTIKEGAKEAIQAMHDAGISKTVMLTGDRKETAVAVAEELALDEIHCELLPADKVDKIEELLSMHEESSVGFVGDGLNDAPVLMRADVGIAMGSLGSDAAIEAADIVIMDDDIGKIPSIVKIAKKTMRIVRENVVFALGVKALILILGAFGVATMWEAVFGDVGVAVIAILNSMRALKTE